MCVDMPFDPTIYDFEQIAKLYGTRLEQPLETQNTTALQPREHSLEVLVRFAVEALFDSGEIWTGVTIVFPGHLVDRYPTIRGEEQIRALYEHLGGYQD